MSAARGAPGPVLPAIFTYVPFGYGKEAYENYLAVDKFSRDNIRWASSTMAGQFVSKTLEWLKTTSGAKSWLIQLPETIYKVAHRYKDSTALPARYLVKFNHWIKPLHIMTPCAKTWLPFADVVAKIPAIFCPVKNYRDYVVIASDPAVDQTPFSYRLDLAKWEQLLNKCETVALWILSLCQCEAVCRKAHNEPARWSIVASIVSPFISAKTICTEGSFLYKAIRRNEYVRVAENGRDRQTVTATIAKQEIYWAGSRIALSIIGLSLDLFNRLAPKGDKPVWLETALFWTSIAPTFLGPAAHYYIPELVVKPLHTSAGIK
jgi:hypothetical protein